ncbi:hypothetical protein NSK_005697 [Nannochloropsis salina CCMP1776]|uniref:Uncharacterized protein n=1 Tax=Nannochloropsis salina CCMP1776 TaxID=1027361 RepID=A0A4D9D331_9STRA|nr:hypothetical protein NSK_005697 [Nannochloropsis salina CCMP1776]|eukprot:TFJ83009.1 hypothetical protein NSK_005697 [Nannochloropsis salina CCMP1776]
MSTNFWVSPADKTVVVAMVQIIPYTQDLKFAARDWTYRSIDAFKRRKEDGFAVPLALPEEKDAQSAATIDAETGAAVLESPKKRALRHG